MYYHSTYLYCSNFELCSGTSSLAPRPVLRDCLDHSSTTARGLRRSLLTHGDCLDHSRPTARGLRLSLLDLFSGTASTTLRPRLGDFIARSSTCARGLLDHSPTTAWGLCVSTTCDWRLAYSWDIFSHLDLATRLIPHLPASSGTTSV